MTIAEYLLAELDAEYPVSRKLIERIPEDQFNFKPHEKSSSLGWLASHIVEIHNWGTVTMEKAHLSLDEIDGPSAQTPDMAQLLDRLQKNYLDFQVSLAKATEAQMLETWTASFQGHTVNSDPRQIVLRGFVFNHIVHHRAQVGMYLRLLGVSIPSTYGPSADEQPS